MLRNTLLSNKYHLKTTYYYQSKWVTSLLICLMSQVQSPHNSLHIPHLILSFSSSLCSSATTWCICQWPLSTQVLEAFELENLVSCPGDLSDSCVAHLFSSLIKCQLLLFKIASLPLFSALVFLTIPQFAIQYSIHLAFILFGICFPQLDL